MALDADTFSVVLSFCDIRTQLQLSRVCRTYNDDVRHHMARHAHIVKCLREVHDSGTADCLKLQSLFDSPNTSAEWRYWLVRAWLHATATIGPQLFISRGHFDEGTWWTIPAQSHTTKHPCVWRQLVCPHQVPSCLVVAGDHVEFELRANCRPANWIYEFLSDHPFVVYGLVRVAIGVLESYIAGWSQVYYYY
jgi:hypothetical protein